MPRSKNISSFVAGVLSRSDSILTVFSSIGKAAVGGTRRIYWTSVAAGLIAWFVFFIGSFLAAQTESQSSNPSGIADKARNTKPISKTVDASTPAKLANTPQSKPAEKASATVMEKGVTTSGDFRDILADKTPSACKQSAKHPGCSMDACAELLAQDYSTIGEVDCLSLSEDRASLIYTPSQAAEPTYIRLGKKNPPNVLYDFLEVKPQAKGTLVTMRQVIAGDFCKSKYDGGKWTCTTDLSPGADPHSVVTDAYVQAADNSQAVKATVDSIGVDVVDVEFRAAADFKPAYLVVVTRHDTYRVAFVPALPTETVDLIFASDRLEDVCDTRTDSGNTIPDCLNTAREHIEIQKTLPGVPGSTVEFRVIQDHLLVTTWTGPMGLEPGAVVIANRAIHRSVVARRTLKPGGNTNLLGVDISIMDQTTTQRNYGDRMAKRYIAVVLDVKNPTAKKVQFNKSALYFDVDYVEAKERKDSRWVGFKQTVQTTVSLGLSLPSVYLPPFVARDKQAPRVSRFGLEQNVRQSPVPYLSALGSFDYTTEMTDAKLKALELVGSVLTNIATGGVVSDASGAFRAGTSVFSGTFLPGVRALVLNTPFINRLRSNLVAQTLQETVQVPAGGATSTIVLVPRAGILEFSDADVPVMIQRLIDVHLIPEVVSEATETPIEKGICKEGYTKAQAREALGEETGLSTAADGSSTFTYNKGPVASASFNIKGTLQSCKARSLSEQLGAATTLAEALKILSDLGLTATKIELTDGSTVLTDIPGVQQNYHFDTKGNISSPTDYAFLFKDIKAKEGKSTKAEFETFLEDKAKSLSTDRSNEIRNTDAKAKGTDGQFRYSSPEIKNGSLTVTFENANKSKTVGPTSVLKKVTFEGDKPKNAP